MLLHNKPFIDEATNDVPRVTFNRLKPGDKYTHSKNIHTVFKRDGDSITVKRYDGWFVTIKKDSEAWRKQVIRIEEPLVIEAVIQKEKKQRESKKPLTQAEKIQLEYLNSLK